MLKISSCRPPSSRSRPNLLNSWRSPSRSWLTITLPLRPACKPEATHSINLLIHHRSVSRRSAVSQFLERYLSWEVGTMRNRMLKSFISIATATVLALIGTVAFALDTAAIDSQVSATLEKFYALSSGNKALAEKAAAVLVFPDITKGGIGIGGEHGNGALQENGKDRWLLLHFRGIDRLDAWVVAPQSGDFV